MSVVVVGLHHRNAPLELLERISIAPATLDDALASLLKSDHISEAVVLSTCMRTEVYVEAHRFHGAVADIREVLCRVSGVDVHELAPYMFEFFDDTAYAHLFRVAAGIESAVLGEGEILGQVGKALADARRAGACRSVLTPLFTHAVRAGKRVRSETAISHGTASIGQAAVVMAADHLGGLDGKSALVVGAGEMGAGMAVTLRRTTGLGRLVISNRTLERAVELAERLDGDAVAFDDVNATLPDVDLVLCSTGAGGTLFTVHDVRAAVGHRNARALLFIDMGMPRDVDAAVAAIDGVSVLNLEDLQFFAAEAQANRAGELDSANAIIAEEVSAYTHGTQERAVAPFVSRLRERAEDVRTGELERHAAKLATLTPEERAAVDALTKSILAKLLHTPTVKIKTEAGSPEGERMLAALRDLLDI